MVARPVYGLQNYTLQLFRQLCAYRSWLKEDLCPRLVVIGNKRLAERREQWQEQAT
jgi:hypothetical protein